MSILGTNMYSLGGNMYILGFNMYISGANKYILGANVPLRYQCSLWVQKSIPFEKVQPQ